jgi:hypothetical protein
LIRSCTSFTPTTVHQAVPLCGTKPGRNWYAKLNKLPFDLEKLTGTGTRWIQKLLTMKQGIKYEIEIFR